MSSTINSTNTVPYLTNDRTELAPLCSTQQDTKGLRVIISFITVFTVLVSMALMTQLHHGDYQVTPHGSVVSDNKDCSFAGVAIMKKGGSAVDAVISTLFCLSVVLPHLVGIGGGGHLLAYDQRKRELLCCFDFQPSMGNNHSLGIGVPGFVAGLYKAHKLLGKMPWSSLLNAAIEIAGSGFTPSASLLSAVPLATGHPDLLELLTSGHNPQLFSTLQILALNGSDELYNGSLSDQMAEFVSTEDLSQYQVVSDTCLTQFVGQHNVVVAGPNSAGPLLLHLLDKLYTNISDNESVANVALHLEATKVISRPYNNGVNVVAADHNDIYVSAVSGLGSVLGSLKLTRGGYIMNNVFRSFPVDEDNRPVTLGSPIIITQAGSACGNRIITGSNDVRDAAQLVMKLLHTVDSTDISSLTSVSDSPRVRIKPHQILVEKNHEPQLDFYQQTLLRKWNFSIEESPEPYPSINFIHKIGDKVTPVADSRGGGSIASF